MDSVPGGSMAPQSWWSRNWKWAAPILGCLGLVASCGCLGAVFLGWGLKTLGDNVGAYTEAVSIATSDDEVRAVLGPPVQGGAPRQTSVETLNGRKQARFTIPLDGSKADGVLHVEAVEEDTGWSYHTLAVELEDGRRIDLRDVAPGPVPQEEPEPPSGEEDALPPPPPPGPPPPPEGPPGSGQGGNNDINL